SSQSSASTCWVTPCATSSTRGCATCELAAFPALDSWFWLLHSRRRRRNLAALRDRNTTTAPPAIRPTMSVHRDSSSELPNHATATTQGVRASTAVSHSRLAGKDV